MLDCSKLLSALKKLAPRSKFLVMRYKNSYAPVLNALVRNGTILNFNITNSYVVVRPRESKIQVSVLSSKASFCVLKRSQYREGGVTSYLVYTDRGLCLSRSAISQHVGGKVIAKLA